VLFWRIKPEPEFPESVVFTLGKDAADAMVWNYD
jgi:hypothetical protein